MTEINAQTIGKARRLADQNPEDLAVQFRAWALARAYDDQKQPDGVADSPGGWSASELVEAGHTQFAAFAVQNDPFWKPPSDSHSSREQYLGILVADAVRSSHAQERLNLIQPALDRMVEPLASPTLESLCQLLLRCYIAEEAHATVDEIIAQLAALNPDSKSRSLGALLELRVMDVEIDMPIRQALAAAFLTEDEDAYQHLRIQTSRFRDYRSLHKKLKPYPVMQSVLEEAHPELKHPRTLGDWVVSHLWVFWVGIFLISMLIRSCI